MRLPSVAVLREREFRLLISARLISQLGNQITITILAFAVLGIRNRASDIGLVLGAEGFAVGAVLLLGGAVGDWMPRRRIMVTADLVRFGTQGGMAILLISGYAHVWHLVLLQVVSGLASAFFVPAVTAIQVEAVSPELLSDANALRGLVIALSAVIGPTIGGLLAVLMNPGDALAVDALTFLLGAVLVSRMRSGSEGVPGGKNVLRGIGEGWREFRSRRWLWTMTGLSSLVWMAVIAPTAVLGPVIANRSLGGPGAWAGILSVQGAGVLVGGFIAMSLRPRRPLLFVVLGTLLMLPVMLLLSFEAPVWAIAATAFFAGLEQSFFWTVWQTTLQQRIPRETLSRVSSFDWLGAYVFNPLGYTVAGPLAGLAGAGATLRAAVAVVAVAAVAVALLPDVRGFTPVTGGASTGGDAMATTDQAVVRAASAATDARDEEVTSSGASSADEPASGTRVGPDQREGE